MIFAHKRKFGFTLVIISFIVLCVLQRLFLRRALKWNDPCYRERYSFALTNISDLRKTFVNTTCLKHDNMNRGLMSYYVPENFLGLGCPTVKVRFSDVDLPKIALASFPGSGNTWVRHLIEHISGIATGSIYCGVTRDIFIGECGRNNNRTIVIKTHKNPGQIYDKVVLIIRNPFDAILAEFNRLVADKMSVAPKWRFESKKWKTFVEKNSRRWQSHVQGWLQDFKGPKHVLFYELLKQNIHQELIKLSIFLGINPTLLDIWCTERDEEGLYHRKKPDWFVPSTLYEWKTFVEKNSRRWQSHVQGWLQDFKGPKHVLFYELLKQNIHQELIKLSIFLGINPTLLDIWCTERDEEGLYHRKKPDWFVPSTLYGETLSEIVHSRINDVFTFMQNYSVAYDIRLNFNKLYRNASYENNL